MERIIEHRGTHSNFDLFEICQVSRKILKKEIEVFRLFSTDNLGHNNVVRIKTGSF